MTRKLTWGELQWMRLNPRVRQEVLRREATKIACEAMGLEFHYYQPTTNTETSNEHDRRPVDA